MLGGRSVTGLCLGRDGTSLVVANWRTRSKLLTNSRGLVITEFLFCFFWVLFSFTDGISQFKIFPLCRQLAELTLDGELMTSFSHRELKEPVSVVVNPFSGNWVVADIGARAVLVFEPSGKLVGMSIACVEQLRHCD